MGANQRGGGDDWLCQVGQLIGDSALWACVVAEAMLEMEIWSLDTLPEGAAAMIHARWWCSGSDCPRTPGEAWRRRLSRPPSARTRSRLGPRAASPWYVWWGCASHGSTAERGESEVITPRPAFIDRRELGLCPTIGQTLEMRHVAATVADGYVIVVIATVADEANQSSRSPESVGIAKAWGK